MRPQCDYILKSIATGLMTNYLPKMDSDKEKAGLTIMSFLLGAVAEEYDRSADRRIEENIALKKLFAESVPVIKDNELKARIESASLEKESDWRISTLDKTNCFLLTLLIELHAHIEILDDENARQTERKIWEELKNYTERRDLAIFDMADAMLLEARKTNKE